MKKRVNKGLSILLSVAMLFAMLPSFSGLMASAEGAENPAEEGTGTAEYWDYIKDGKYQYADFSPFADGNGGLQSGDYTISKPEELAGLMVIVNNSKPSKAGDEVTLTDKKDKFIKFTAQQSFDKKTITISNDINLSGIELENGNSVDLEWVPIGKGEGCPFKATVKGKVNPATNEVTKITGMKIGTESAPADYAYAGLIGHYEGTDTTGSKGEKIPAISNIGIGEGSAVYISRNGYGNAYAGGIVGEANSGSISNCNNTGAISATAASANANAYAGGIVGYAYYGSISNCYNEGAISASGGSWTYAGGIVGYVNVYNYGYGSVTQKISDCYNTGAISGEDYAGGILGSAEINNYGSDSVTQKISDCYNTGAISGEDYAGGILGFDDASRTIEHCYYTGAEKGVGNKNDTDYTNLKNILAEAQSNLKSNESIANTSASLALRADNKDDKSQKLGADFAMVYYFELEGTDGTKIVPDVKVNGNVEYLDFSNLDKTFTDAKFKGIEITQNALTENGYTGSAVKFYQPLNLSNDFPVDVYKVTFKDGEKNMTDSSLPKSYRAGEGLTLPTASDIQKTGYKFAGWYDNKACTGTAVTEISTDATGDKTFYAKFLKTNCTITIDDAIQNGTVTSDKNEADEEETVTLTVTPDPGYKLKAGSLKYTYTDTDNQTKEVPITENKFTMPPYNVTVTAKFEKIVYPTNHDVTIDQNIQNGKVTAEPAKAKAGNTVTLTVTPNAGYQLKTLTVDGKAVALSKVNDNKYTFKMPSHNVTVTAEFEVASGYREIKVDPNTENVTITPDKTAAKPGETVTVTVEPEDGYEVDKIYVNGEEIPLGADHKFSFTVPESGDVVIEVTMQKLDSWVRDPINFEASGTPRWYYYKDSEKLTGWQEVQAAGETGPVKRYYFNPARGNAAHTGWMQDETGSWYYFAVNNYRDNTPLKSPAEGLAAMWTGWANDGGPEWYYLDATTGKMHTGWTQDGGSEWYYLDATDGDIKIGWQFISGKWYYFTDDKSENMRHYGQMQTGWQFIGGEWYYFYADGAMAANTLIDSYRVDENGRWVA